MPFPLWFCAFCGKSERDFRYGEYTYQPYRIVMAQHAYGYHGVEPHELAEAVKVDGTWVLPDGRVWIRQGFIVADDPKSDSIN
jgi:hypothetical protein